MQFFTASILKTSDGSNTLTHPILGDTYHSIYGAAMESCHVYIDCGLKYINRSDITLFEMGFGSGLNALLTLDYALKNNILINYTAVELYPLSIENIEQMEFEKLVDPDVYKLFVDMHNAIWGEKVAICNNFSITKLNQDLILATLPNDIDLVYFDAFAPDLQPMLWRSEQFERLYTNMTEGGVLTTYSSKGIVKQALRSVGFNVKRLSGVAGKRHILRCTK